MTSVARPLHDFSIGPFRESATRWLDDPQARPEPTTPTRAATVMLVRGEPLEVFMIERAATMDFAPSTWVFPGGRVDPGDMGLDDLPDPRVRLGDGGAQAWASRVGLPPRDALAVLACALRELFEEAGVLLASRGAGDGIVDVSTHAWRERRTQLEAHELSFTEVTHGLTLRGDLVEAVDRWITPEFEKRRFDTWFLTALLPEDATADALSRESQQGRWVRPARMLEEAAGEGLRLLPPTRTALTRLARAADGDEALARARQASFEPTRPRVVAGPDGPFLQAEVNL